MKTRNWSEMSQEQRKEFIEWVKAIDTEELLSEFDRLGEKQRSIVQRHIAKRTAKPRYRRPIHSSNLIEIGI